MVLMANRYILPAALEYQKQVGQSVAAVKAGGGTSNAGQEAAGARTRSWSTSSRRRPTRWPALLEHSGGSAEKHAKYMRDKVVPAMAKLREIGDQIEVLTPHETLAAADLSRDAVREVRQSENGEGPERSCSLLRPYDGHASPTCDPAIQVALPNSHLSGSRTGRFSRRD